MVKNRIQESLHLDYKRSEALEDTQRSKNEISKDISSFANSDGGMIVYGIEEREHIPIRIDNGIASKGKREWLEQVIDSRIHPRISGIRIKQIDLSPNPSRAVFIVQIPIGFTAHQAHDLKYYRRHNFRSAPMHDYEIKMVINRFKEPNLQLSFDLGQPKDGLIPLEIFVKNMGRITASAAHFRLLIPSYLFHSVNGKEWYAGSETAYEGLKVKPLLCNWGGPNKLDFFPGLMIPLSASSRPDRIWIIRLPQDVLMKIRFRYSHQRAKRISSIDIPLFYEIYATDMEPKKGKVFLHIDTLDNLSIKTEKGDDHTL